MSELPAGNLGNSQVDSKLKDKDAFRCQEIVFSNTIGLIQFLEQCFGMSAIKYSFVSYIELTLHSCNIVTRDFTYVHALSSQKSHTGFHLSNFQCNICHMALPFSSFPFSCL